MATCIQMRAMLRITLDFTEDDRVVATLPVFHVFALTVVVNAPLVKGATILLVPRFSPAEVFKVVKEQQATIFAAVPTMYNFLYQFPDADPSDFKSVRTDNFGWIIIAGRIAA